MSTLCSPAPATATADLEAVKGRQQAAWSSGDDSPAALSGRSADAAMPVTGRVVCRDHPKTPQTAVPIQAPLLPLNPTLSSNAAESHASSTASSPDVDASPPSCLSFAGHLVLALFIVAVAVHTLDKVVFLAAPTPTLSDERPRTHEPASDCSFVTMPNASPKSTAGIEGTVASNADRVPGRGRSNLRCPAAPAVGPG